MDVLSRGRALRLTSVALLSLLIASGSVVAADVLGPKKVVVLRTYFQDYANTSRYTKAQVESMFDDLDQLWQDTSYGKISITHEVSDLFQLPSNRSAYVDDFATGDLSNGGKYKKVINDAIANSPSGLDWSDVDAVMVVMAETDTSQFHRGQGNKCTAAMGPGGSNKLVGCAIFSENPSDTDVNVWGRWAHEMGHALQVAGPAHPSNYNSEFELMDNNLPGQTGVVEKEAHVGFPGWLPPSKYLEVAAGPNVEGQTQCLWAEEYDPAGRPNYQALKAKITNSLYYMISTRRKVLGDDLNGDSNGIPDEGILIERVEEGAAPWVTVKGPGGDRNKLWHQGDSYTDPTDGILIAVENKADEDDYCVTVRFDKGADQPDVALYPWLGPPGNTYETTDIWVDGPINGFGTYRYGMWNDLSGQPVPSGNGDDPAIGLANRLYARVRNWGSIAATDVVVHWDVTDPLGVGIAGSSGWAGVGSVDKTSFPGLASIAPGAFVDVYTDWTPNPTLTPEQIAAGVFAFHSCVRVRLDAVSGEIALGNQDGNREQENIDYFEASPAGPGPAYENVVRLHNDDLVNPKFFYLSYDNEVPPDWTVEVNGGDLGVELAPGEVREVPVVIKPQSAAPVGSVFGVDIEASSQRTLVNDLNPNDTHIEFESLGGVRVETRVMQPTEIECEARSAGRIQVEGTLVAEELRKFIREEAPPVVLIQGVDKGGGYIQTQGASAVVPVGADGAFGGYLFSEKSPIVGVRCLFAGTELLGSASTPVQPVGAP